MAITPLLVAGSCVKASAPFKGGSVGDVQFLEGSLTGAWFVLFNRRVLCCD